MNITVLLTILLLASLATVLVIANYKYKKLRAAMTDEEKKIDDAEDAIYRNTW